VSRFARRIDDSHRAIVAGLEAHGVRVISLAALGKGVPDLLCGWRGRWVLLEVKDGSKPPSARKLTPAEAHFLALCRADGLPAYVVESVKQAVDVVTKGDAHVG